jgi:hypothetical protein
MVPDQDPHLHRGESAGAGVTPELPTRPFVIRADDFNRTLSNCSTGVRQEAEVLYTATAFVGLQRNPCNCFIERHPKICKKERENLEQNWTFNFGIHEYLLARLDIIEGRQDDYQSHALAETQQVRVRPLLGRGSISAETYRLFLCADTRAKISAATSLKPMHTNNRGSDSAGKSKNSAKSKRTKSEPPGSNGK